jgi:NDP-sugar pyrophosphorylase family protein
MKAVVLVGGEGTRLRPLTFTTPKPLLPVANQVFLERQLSWLAAHGVDEVALSLGYLPDAFRARFPEGRFVDGANREVRLVYAVEPVPLGTAGAVRFAAEHLGVGERIVVCNGDVLTGLDLGALVSFHDGRQAEATIHLARVDDPSAFGVVPTFADGEVKAFVEKPPRGAAPTDWINAGTYVLEPSILERIPAGLCVSIERETFPRLLEQRGRLFAMPSDAYWIDIGTPDQYLQVHADLLAGRLGPCPVPGAHEAAPGIWIQGDATPEGLGAPVLVGPDCRIEGDARVSGSVLGAAVRVAPGAVVAQSVLHDDVTVAAGARVRDSIIGTGAVIGADAEVVDRSIVGANAVVELGGCLVRARRPATAAPATSP